MTTSTRNKPCCPTCGQPMPPTSDAKLPPLETDAKLPPLETDDFWLDVDWAHYYFTIAWCEPEDGFGHSLGEDEKRGRGDMEKELREQLLAWNSATTEEAKGDAWNAVGFLAVEIAAFDYRVKFPNRVMDANGGKLTFETEAKAKTALKTIRANAMELIQAAIAEGSS